MVQGERNWMVTYPSLMDTVKAGRGFNMDYIIILSALFVGGILYILITGATILKDDDLIQENIKKELSNSHN